MKEKILDKNPPSQLDGQLPVLLRHGLGHRLGLGNARHQRQTHRVRPDQRNHARFCARRRLEKKVTGIEELNY